MNISYATILKNVVKAMGKVIPFNKPSNSTKNKLDLCALCQSEEKLPDLMICQSCYSNIMKEFSDYLDDMLFNLASAIPSQSLERILIDKMYLLQQNFYHNN